MKNCKKFILLLSFILVSVALFFIAKTYSKYLTEATGSANIPIARWNIKVNNKSITSDNNDISSTIVPVFEGSTHIAPGIIAPTAEGYFDLDFDFSAVDVSFSYTVSLSNNGNSSVRDLVITGYSIDGGEIVNFTNSDTSISDEIDYGSNILGRTIRIYIKWDDSANASMNNIADTAATKSHVNALVDVNIAFEQIV